MHAAETSANVPDELHEPCPVFVALRRRIACTVSLSNDAKASMARPHPSTASTTAPHGADGSPWNHSRQLCCMVAAPFSMSMVAQLNLNATEAPLLDPPSPVGIVAGKGVPSLVRQSSPLTVPHSHEQATGTRTQSPANLARGLHICGNKNHGDGESRRPSRFEGASPRERRA